MIKTPNIKLLKNEQYINNIDFWHSIIKIQYISNHLKPKNFKEYKFGHSWINESKSPNYSTVKPKGLLFTKILDPGGLLIPEQWAFDPKLLCSPEDFYTPNYFCPNFCHVRLKKVQIIKPLNPRVSIYFRHIRMIMGFVKSGWEFLSQTGKTFLI